MNIFNRIAVPDPNGTLEKYRDRIDPFSREHIVFHETPAEDHEEFIRRCAGADAVLIGWTSKLPREVMENCPDLIYIGLACTLFEGEGANVDLEYARSRGMSINGVRDYGDTGVGEFVVSEIVRFLQTSHPRKELEGRKVGVIGAGGAGAPTALALQKMGARVSYFSRSSKKKMEDAGIPRKELPELAADSEVLSLHLPRNIELIDAGVLAQFSGKLILNTSLGLPINEEAIKTWLEDEKNCLAADASALGPLLEEREKYPNISYLPYQAGFTTEAEIRLAEKVAANMLEYLK